MSSPGFILGFHGCDQAVAERILAGKEDVRTSTNNHDWLGSGAYFWENNPARALSWAKFLAANPRSGRRKVESPSVIGAILAPGYCLDLTEESSLSLVNGAYHDLVRAYEYEGISLPKNEPGYKGDEDFVRRNLDCAVLNFLYNTRAALGLPAFDTVRAPFLEGGSLFPGSKLAAKAHVQWCVINPRKSIIGYFRPRDINATTA
jgi:hypothetical protein